MRKIAQKSSKFLVQREKMKHNEGLEKSKMNDAPNLGGSPTQAEEGCGVPQNDVTPPLQRGVDILGTSRHICGFHWRME
jgi:hypothetical protein